MQPSTLLSTKGESYPHSLLFQCAQQHLLKFGSPHLLNLLAHRAEALKYPCGHKQGSPWARQWVVTT